MNGNYNRPLTLTDFLYVLVFFLGLYSIISLECSNIYVFYIVITVSLIVDWTSAFTMSASAGGILLFSDIITVSNYLCLYRALMVIDATQLSTYLRFFFHYAIVFLIYLLWNLIVLKSNSVTHSTKNFFIVYTILASICTCSCFAFFILIYFNFISLSICHIFAWSICGVHSLILVTWIIKTFIIKEKSKNK